MSKYSRKFKRALALVLTFVMAVSVITVTPSTNVEAASNKVVKSLAGVPAAKTMNVGETTSFKANVKTTKKVAKNLLQVTVKSSDSSVVAAKVAAKPKNKKKAKKGASVINLTAGKAGTATITVTTKAKNKKNKKVTKKMVVTVAEPTTQATTEAPKPQPTQPAITVPDTQKNIKLDAGSATTITIQNADGKELEYSTSDASVATVNPKTGVIVGIGTGTATITVKTKDGKESVSITVTVSSIAVTGVTLPETAEITVSGTTTLTAVVTPENATDKLLEWSSDNETVAKVDKTSGKITGVAAGTATITAKASNGVYGSCVVTVKSKEVLADGVTMEVTNPYVDANGTEYENTVLVGKPMTVKVRVASKNAPVGGVAVSLKLAYQYGTMNGAFEIVGDSNQTSKTDENGYAQFTVQLKDGYNYKATDYTKYQSMELTATESGSAKTAALAVKFASIKVNGISVDQTQTNLTPGDNAAPGESGVFTTYSENSEKTEEYVVSQQTSGSKADHKVVLDATPELYIPATKETVKRGSWTYDVPNGTSGKCTVYNDSTNKATTVFVQEVPAGLNYITLTFSKLSLSKYVALYVDVYDKTTGELLKEKRKTRDALSNGSPTVQIEAQDDRESYIVVSLVSQGQVDTDSEGYVLKSLEGNYKETIVKDYTIQPIEGAVKWTEINDVAASRYETVRWNYAEAEKYLPDDSKFSNADYQYAYSVPSFPLAGNAIITVRDANGKVLAYYTYPSVNNGKNVNVLAPAPEDKDDSVAILISEEEAQNMVGDFKQQGDQAVIDSTKNGRTFVEAKINIAGLNDEELNAQNGGVLYSSISWAPIPNTTEVTKYDDFFAIEGQFVNVLAQIYDENGNVKTKDGEQLTFKYSNGSKTVDVPTNDKGLIDNGVSVGNNVVVANVSNNGATDEKGQVKLTLKDTTNDGYFSFINQLTATAKDYDVKLSIVKADDTIVKTDEKFNINWVDLGLTFVDSALDADGPVRTSWFENATGTIAKSTTYAVDSAKGWQIGYQPIARSSKFQYSRPTDVDRFPMYVGEGDNVKKYEPVHEFKSVSGLKINYQALARKTKVEQRDNNSAAVYSEVTGKDALTGTLSLSTEDVVFAYYDDDGNEVKAVNIGTGDANIGSTSLTLNINWNPDGQQVNLFYPKSINQNTKRRVFVQVLDKLNNPLVGKTVEYQISGVNATKGKVKAIEDTAHSGIYYFDLDKVEALGDVKECTINVYVNGDSIGDPIKIAYQKDPGKAFKFFVDTDKEYAVEVVNDTTIDVYFNHDVDKDVVNAGMFDLRSADGTKLEIVSATLDSTNATKVRLVLQKAIDTRTAQHTLTIGEYVDAAGVSYYLADKYGQIMNGEKYDFVPSER